jgi:hypothetical protein
MITLLQGQSSKSHEVLNDFKFPFGRLGPEGMAGRAGRCRTLTLGRERMYHLVTAKHRLST